MAKKTSPNPASSPSIGDRKPTTSYDPYALPAEAVREPPTTLWQTLRMIGPGIVLAGTIVGSGELLITTGLGATSGYSFLWLILLSCLIKVFIQIELGRYAIASGKPTLGALDEINVPRFGANFLVWWWFIMMLATVFQLGGMTSSIGQALNLTFFSMSESIVENTGDSTWVLQVCQKLQLLVQNRPWIWAFGVCGSAMLLLWSGSYRRIEWITTAIVVTVTLLTVTATIALSWTRYPIRWNEVVSGLNPLHSMTDLGNLATAFTVFGITGVGATELFYYPYWCLEKGYARYVGVNDNSDAWNRRARGWIRVMYFDAWTSMIVFTISTVSFYFMGASVLNPQNLVPEKKDMIATLSRMFVDSFGGWTQALFLLGACAVLFKTLYLSCAGNARMTADFLGLNRSKVYADANDRARWIHRLTLLFPVVALVLCLMFSDPKTMIQIGGCAQATTLPMIACAALYFRYKKLNPALVPSKLWDATLWLAGILISLVAIYSFVTPFIQWLNGPRNS